MPGTRNRVTPTARALATLTRSVNVPNGSGQQETWVKSAPGPPAHLRPGHRSLGFLWCQQTRASFRKSLNGELLLPKLQKPLHRLPHKKGPSVSETSEEEAEMPQRAYCETNGSFRQQRGPYRKPTAGSRLSGSRNKVHLIFRSPQLQKTTLNLKPESP